MCPVAGQTNLTSQLLSSLSRDKNFHVEQWLLNKLDTLHRLRYIQANRVDFDYKTYRQKDWLDRPSFFRLWKVALLL